MEKESGIKKFALNLSELQITLGIGRSKAFELTRQPGFPAVRIGRRILIPVDALHEWLAEQVKSNDDL
ncbi:MAG: helix-turn-helix domain-containing protein [Chloroflexi bacterium]|nr:helix-turn-helix domain-containing protein [Chloroflexota bacterium]